MKAAPFEYSRPTSVEETCALLASDENARIIAGGQTLVPMMAMRLARPSRLVDVAHIAEMSFIRDDGGTIAIGAATRQCAAERSALIAEKLPLLARALPWIGPTITALPQGACMTHVQFPVWGGRIGTGFHEVNARRSDFAFAAAAAQVELSDDGTCARIALGVGGITDMPVRLDEAEQALIDTSLEPDAVRDVVHGALTGIECTDDLHASAEYRRRAALTLALRAVADAKLDAEGRRHAR